MDAARQASRTAIGIFLVSRAWVLLVALVALFAFGVDAVHQEKFASPAVEPFIGNGQAISLWGRWDSTWYLNVANSAYAGPGSEVFFPLYPMVSRALGEFGNLVMPLPEAIFGGALVLALACFAGGLYLLHRLTELELGPDVATLTVALVAFFPMAVFFGAIHSEGPFLLASVAAFWFARTDRWAEAGMAGCLAALTRSTGVVVVAPLALIYLLGPRGTGAGARPYLGLPWRRPPGAPRTYPLRANALWILLVPAGLAAYMLYLGLSQGNPLELAEAQSERWGRELQSWGPIPVGPLAGLVDGARAAVEAIGDVVDDPSLLAIWSPDGGDSLVTQGINLEAAIFLALGLAATAGALRRLPLAYGAYAALAIALPLSFPVELENFPAPLFSMPRFLAVVFPLFMWLALWLRERRLERPALALSALLLALYSAQWATWQWVS